MKVIDLKGKKFGRLTIIDFAEIRYRRAFWLCECVCGNVKIVDGIRLRSGKTRSCGCLRREMSAERGRRLNTIHGGSYTSEYRIWISMRSRCLDETHTSYHNYGGRGIKVCDRWRESFVSFLEDMGPRPSLQHSIDRIDNDGDYTPKNCRWATMKEQRRNSRQNRFIIAFGERRTLIEWSECYGIGPRTISRRLEFGWPTEDAIARPVRGS